MKQLFKNALPFTKYDFIYFVLGIISLLCTCYGILKGFLLEETLFPYGVSKYHPSLYMKILFHISSIVSAAFIVYAFSKFLSFKSLLDVNNKKTQIFISSWINISYLIYASCYYNASMLDARQAYYPPDGDSIFILIANLTIFYAIIGLFYYILMNIFLKKIYMRTFSSKTLKILCSVLILLGGIDITICRITSYYSYNDLVLDILAIVWILLISILMRYGLNSESNEGQIGVNKTNIHFSWLIFIITSLMSLPIYIYGKKDFFLYLIISIGIICGFTFSEFFENKCPQKVQKCLTIIRRIITALLILIPIALLLYIIFGRLLQG